MRQVNEITPTVFEKRSRPTTGWPISSVATSCSNNCDSWLVSRYCSYLLPRQDGGTSQIEVIRGFSPVFTRFHKQYVSPCSVLWNEMFMHQLLPDMHKIFYWKQNVAKNITYLCVEYEYVQVVFLRFIRTLELHGTVSSRNHILITSQVLNHAYHPNGASALAKKYF